MTEFVPVYVLFVAGSFVDVFSSHEKAMLVVNTMPTDTVWHILETEMELSD